MLSSDMVVFFSLFVCFFYFYHLSKCAILVSDNSNTVIYENNNICYVLPSFSCSIEINTIHNMDSAFVNISMITVFANFMINKLISVKYKQKLWIHAFWALMFSLTFQQIINILLFVVLQKPFLLSLITSNYYLMRDIARN